MPAKPRPDQFRPWGVNAKYTGPTFETDTIALQAVHGLSEEVLSGGGHSRDIVLFPLNRSIYMFKDLLDRVGNFGSNTVTWNQGDLCHAEF